MSDNVQKWRGRYPLSPSLVRAASGGLSSSCTTAMKMPPPGGISTGSGGGRGGRLGPGEGTLPPPGRALAHIRHPRMDISERASQQHEYG